MIAGFKIGLRDWKEKLEATHPPFVEVYFRIDKIPQYREMFAYLKEHQIKFGLHFWGVLKNHIEPNLLSRHKWIQNQSVMLMQMAIKVAAEHQCVYVNVHPGALKERMLDLDASVFKIADLPETEFEEGRKNLLENVKRLKKITEKYGVLLTYETLPTNCPIKWLAPRGPQNILRAMQCPIEFYEVLMNAGCFLANDFGHTASSIVSDNREEVLKFVVNWTKKLVPATKLIHCNVTLSPFDGVDVHSGLLPEDFAKDTLPNKEELIELLKIFKNREDVYVLNEPEDRHVENYHALLNLLSQL
jgi:hypothetical protein